MRRIRSLSNILIKAMFAIIAFMSIFFTSITFNSNVLQAQQLSDPKDWIKEDRIKPNFTEGAVSTVATLSSSAEPIDHVIIEVNDGAILFSDFLRAQELAKINAGFANQELELNEQINQQIIQQLISDRLQLQSARKYNMKISDNEVLQQMSTIASNNNISLEEFKAKFSKYGPKAFEIFRRNMKDQMLISRTYWAISASRIRITREEVDQRMHIEYKPTYNINYVLIYLDPDDNSSTSLEHRRSAQILSKKIFKDLSMSAYTDQELQEKYGKSDDKFRLVLYRDRKIDQLPSVVANVVEGMGDKGIKLFKNKNGFNIVMLEAKQLPDQKPISMYHLQHILLKINPARNTKRTESELKKIRKNIISGNSTFADMARLYSEDVSNNYQGGDLGWQQAQDVPPTFSEELKSMEINSISKPIYVNNSWRIFLLADKKDESPGSDAVREQIRNHILQNRLFVEVMRLQTELREQSYIRYVDSRFKPK